MRRLASISPDVAAAVESAARLLVLGAQAGRGYEATSEDLVARFRSAAVRELPALAPHALDLLTKQFAFELLERASAIGEMVILATKPAAGSA